MTAKFQGVDFYSTDSLLQEEERAVRDTVRSWVDDNLLPIIGEAYVAGHFPKPVEFAELLQTIRVLGEEPPALVVG